MKATLESRALASQRHTVAANTDSIDINKSTAPLLNLSCCITAL
ncbi:unnamed protein product [Chondrus crispus]|uniref:Uncharacterized protein n=1 Tax=Chondrus crispus TaxID=2769 RepID=R7QGL2_CHOCR|nr:unnamed protein product [Chondrus crispus]CDF37229.1 unnamed protein product [Chondrus crispus]|eukprot:XP_005717048.1 unnamed protein product [Chondrus crispus]